MTKKQTKRRITISPEDFLNKLFNPFFNEFIDRNYKRKGAEITERLIKGEPHEVNYTSETEFNKYARILANTQKEILFRDRKISLKELKNILSTLIKIYNIDLTQDIKYCVLTEDEFDEWQEVLVQPFTDFFREVDNFFKINYFTNQIKEDLTRLIFKPKNKNYTNINETLIHRSKKKIIIPIVSIFIIFTYIFWKYIRKILVEANWFALSILLLIFLLGIVYLLLTNDEDNETVHTDENDENYNKQNEILYDDENDEDYYEDDDGDEEVEDYDDEDYF